MRPPHLRDSTASPRLASIRLLIAWSAVAFSLLLPSLAPAVGFGCDPLVPVGGPLCPHDPLLPSMAEDRDLTTSFVPDLTPPVITNVVTTPGPFSATVTWTTDVPASSVASYGPSTAYENGAIQQTTLVTQHSLLLPNLLPSSTYHVEVSSVAVNGVADIGPDGTFTTTPHSGIVSDDFNLACGVLGAEWTAVDPLLDASFDVVGVGTQNAHLEIGVAAGIAHDLWVTGMDAPRLMQASADEDFEVEVKFESVPVSTVQGQGILVEESNGNFVRFDVYSTSGALRIFSASMVNFSPNIRINSAIAAPPAGEITLRVKRQGASWTYDYSYDGQNWITAAIFNHTLTVTQVGVTALNASGSPAFTAVADYFFETATRIVPEDGTVSGNPSPKLLTVNVVGGGSVTKSPDQGSYACGDQVTLTAVANVGNAFTDWSGDVTSTVNPLILTMSADRNVTATFVPDTSPPLISNVSHTTGPFSATVTWTTDVPATSVVSFGPTVAYENGTIQQTPLVTQHSVTLPSLTPSSTYHYEVSSVGGNGIAAFHPDQTLTTPADTGGPSGLVSDDFNVACGLLGPQWTTVDPLLDASFDIFGVGTSAAHLEIGVAGGAPHDMWVTGMNAPRVMQTSADTDFQFEVRFESVPVSSIQGQGIVVEESNGNFVRFDVFSNSGALFIFAASFVGFTATIETNSAIAAAPSGEISLRVTRAADVFTLEYSYDGLAWITATTFTHVMAVSQVGVFALNSGSDPAFTAIVDYAFETASPIVPEDGTVSGDPSPKTLTVGVNGSGSVSVSPDQPTYTCGAPVALTAIPDMGNAFTNWSGDIVSSDNPLLLSMVADRNVTANFIVDVTPPVISNVVVTPGPFAASVTWSTDIPATSIVRYGPTIAYENGTLQQTSLVTQHSLTLTNLVPSSTYHLEVSSVAGNGIADVEPDQSFVTPPDSGGGSPTGITSDDFNRENLDTATWTYTSPLDDTYVMTSGAGTPDADLILSIPIGTAHDAWTGGLDAPRITQNVANGDFEVEAKFASLPNASVQGQGILVESIPGSFLRFDVFSDGVALRVFAASFVAFQATTQVNTPISVPAAGEIYLRVNRQGDSWTFLYSEDGQTWITATSFIHATTINRVGVFALNAGAAPAFDAVVDYFFVTDTPVSPEDGTTPPDDLAPLIHRVQTFVGATAMQLSWRTDEPGTSVGRYGLTSSYELGMVSDPILGHDHAVVLENLTANTTYFVEIQSMDALSQVSTQQLQVTTPLPGANGAPLVDVWYGTIQRFGHIGLPQPWANILGTATDPDGVASLSYSLNGGPEWSLNMGPDTRRLADLGDFNADIDIANLQLGMNTVAITATDTLGNQSVTLVFVEYDDTNVWPSPYSITDWSTVVDLQDVVQVVDGKWDIVNGLLRPQQIDYDRFVCVGDLVWGDYEVTVPITIHSFDPGGFLPPSNNPAVGIIMRWVGHTQTGSHQPARAFYPLGAIGWHLFESNGDTQLRIAGNLGIVTRARKPLAFDVPYIFKMRVETIPGVGGLYSLKVWQEGTTEPTAWDVQQQASLSDPQAGSVCPVAHHVDASFGPVDVTPLP